MSKRIKISLKEINKGKITIISNKDISETNARIRKAMRKMGFGRYRKEDKEEILFI